MKHILRIAVAAGVALAFSLVARAGEKGETVELKSVPAAVQKTFKAEAKDGEIVRVKKENEDGKVSYEALMKRNGKQWEVEVDPSGKILDQHEEGKDHRDKGEKHEKEED